MKMPKIERRNGKPSIRFQANGTGKRFTGETEADCQQWWLARLAEFERGETARPEPKAAGAVRELLEKYRTIELPRKPRSARNKTSKLRQFAEIADFIDLPVLKIEVDHFEGWIRQRRGQVADTTINGELNLWGHIWKIGKREKWCGLTRQHVNPVNEIDRDAFDLDLRTKRTRIFRSRADRRRIFAYLKAHDPAVFELSCGGYFFGMRLSELLRVTKGNVIDKIMVLHDVKNGEAIDERPTYRAARLWLARHCRRLEARYGRKLRPDDRLFPWGFTGSYASEKFKEACRAAGCPELSFRSLRADFATRMYRMTKDSAMAAKFTGHKGIKVFHDHYCMITAAEVADLY